MAISHRIVSRYGGSVSVESEPGKGSTFTVQFPLCDQPQKAAEIASKAPRPAEKFTVLLIDDMGPVVAVCKAALERFGHKALTADSGAAALEIFKETPIDVALCDLGLPEMNGWEVGKRIVEICRDRDVAKPPFILFTGWGGQVLDKAKIVESGVDGVIAKPIEISKLIKVISELGASRKGEKGR